MAYRQPLARAEAFLLQIVTGDNAVRQIWTLKEQWGGLTLYELFEQIVSRIVMLLISAIIIYSLILVSMDLFNQLTFDRSFPDTTALKDVFGSILTVLILLEFNHSIVLATTKRTGILQARGVVLIVILVISRKVILLDFSATSFESLIGIGGSALAFGVLYVLISPSPRALISSQSKHSSDAGP
jgi:uncharacterized membrane protein (DUF373 family)